jgi:hypothetical protein
MNKYIIDIFLYLQVQLFNFNNTLILSFIVELIRGEVNGGGGCHGREV